MKKKIVLLISVIILTIIAFFGYRYYEKLKIEKFVLPETEVDDLIYEEPITNLQAEYQNDDIKGVLYIENTDFSTPVVQGKDNDFYLKHLPDKSYFSGGSVFFDYRIDIESSPKTLVFGHSSQSRDYPIETIEEYENPDFYEEHKYIYLDTKEEHKKFLVIGYYIETSDWNYMQVDFKNEEDINNHYQYLLSKTFYNTGEKLNGNDKILIIQTCSTNKEYKKYAKKYFLLLAKKIDN